MNGTNADEAAAAAPEKKTDESAADPPATPVKDTAPVAAQAAESTTESKQDSLSPSPAVAPMSGYPYNVAGYYVGGGGQEPPSPGINMGGAVYDTGSFFQTSAAAAAGGPFHSSAFGAAGSNTPLSPPRPSAMMGVIPPASPLFPRVTMMDPGQHPPSPNLPYMSTALPGMYSHYGVGLSSGSSNSLDEAIAWNDR